MCGFGTFQGRPIRRIRNTDRRQGRLDAARERTADARTAALDDIAATRAPRNRGVEVQSSAQRIGRTPTSSARVDRVRGDARGASFGRTIRTPEEKSAVRAQNKEKSNFVFRQNADGTLSRDTPALTQDDGFTRVGTFQGKPVFGKRPAPKKQKKQEQTAPKRAPRKSSPFRGRATAGTGTFAGRVGSRNPSLKIPS